MELSHLLTWTCLLVVAAIQGEIPGTSAKPTYSLLNGGYIDSSYDSSYYYPDPITDYHLRRLRRGYYYVDNGYITPVSQSDVLPATANAQRRQVSDGTVAGSPLVKYKQTRTKRKKLFVPNFFG